MGHSVETLGLGWVEEIYGPFCAKGEDDAHVHTQAKVEAFVLISSYEVLKFYFDCMEARYENDKQDNDVI